MEAVARDYPSVRPRYPAVAPSVVPMSSPRLPYDDAATATEMAADCRVVGAALRLPTRPGRAERTARAAARPAPSLRYEDQPREVAKPLIEIGDAAARLAAVFHPSQD